MKPGHFKNLGREPKKLANKRNSQPRELADDFLVLDPSEPTLTKEEF